MDKWTGAQAPIIFGAGIAQDIGRGRDRKAVQADDDDEREQPKHELLERQIGHSAPDGPSCREIKSTRAAASPLQGVRLGLRCGPVQACSSSRLYQSLIKS